jgi:shikimate dehydrogenase
LEFGLVGKSLKHSWSQTYFTDKFNKLGLEDYSYTLFEMESISQVRTIVEDNKNLNGFNVTIPYKETIIPFLDSLDKSAKEIGAVNCVKVIREARFFKLKGYNTDYLAFKHSISEILLPTDKNALVLGNGGASKAVQLALKKLGINFDLCTRDISGTYTYSNLHGKTENFDIIINTTPVGMFPNVTEQLDYPYQEINERQLIFDLIYNPVETLFIKMGKKRKSRIKNGVEMLYLQADYSWQIWAET